jgi:hypothetical protein
MLATLYPSLLIAHSYLRWLVLLAAVVAVIVCFLGLLGGKPFKPGGRKTGAIFTGLLDLQFLLGLALYFISPIVGTALKNMSAAMKIPELRFFAVEHSTVMILGVILAHIGSIRSKRAPDDKTAYSRALLWYTIVLILLLWGTPWSLRPLFRSMAS